MKNMCKKKILYETSNGKLIQCLSCNLFHIEFKDQYFTLNADEFNSLRRDSVGIDLTGRKKGDTDQHYKRKIWKPISLKKATKGFNIEDLKEFECLYNQTYKACFLHKTIKCSRIELSMSWN